MVRVIVVVHVRVTAVVLVRATVVVHGPVRTSHHHTHKAVVVAEVGSPLLFVARFSDARQQIAV